MSLRIPHFDLQETLGDTIHFLNLNSKFIVFFVCVCSVQEMKGSIMIQTNKETCWRLWFQKSKRVGCEGRGLTVCSRPPRRGSSKTLLRAKGDTVVIVSSLDGNLKFCLWVKGSTSRSGRGGVTTTQWCKAEAKSMQYTGSARNSR